MRTVPMSQPGPPGPGSQRPRLTTGHPPCLHTPNCPITHPTEPAPPPAARRLLVLGRLGCCVGLLLGRPGAGQISFTEESGKFSVLEVRSYALGDYDNDGWLDMFRSAKTPGERIALLHNEGKGRFYYTTGMRSGRMASFVISQQTGALEPLENFAVGDSPHVGKNSHPGLKNRLRSRLKIPCDPTALAATRRPAGVLRRLLKTLMAIARC